MLVKIGNKWFDPVSVDAIEPSNHNEGCILTTHQGYEYQSEVTADKAAEIINEGIKENMKLDISLLDDEDDADEFWKK